MRSAGLEGVPIIDDGNTPTSTHRDLVQQPPPAIAAGGEGKAMAKGNWYELGDRRRTNTPLDRAGSPVVTAVGDIRRTIDVDVDVDVESQRWENWNGWG